VVTGAVGLISLTPILGCEPDNLNELPKSTDPQPLRIPTSISGGNIAASYGPAQVWPGPMTPALLLNGFFLGPTIKISKGAGFTSQFVNQLGEPSNIHWHGLNVPPEMDGHPMDSVTSGSIQYTFPVLNRAGTYWYHAHPDMLTGKQAYSGFAGFFIIQDQEELALQLPNGDFDIPLLIQDKRTSASSSRIDYTPNSNDIISGFLGNEVFVNGTPNAYLEVKRQAYRLRLLNGSNARVYKIAFDDNRAFSLIATDGGLLDRPYPVESVLLSPGERVEIIVSFEGDIAGKSLRLVSQEFQVAGSHAGAEFQQGQPLNILELRVLNSESVTYSLPTSLSNIEQLNQADAVREKVFPLTMDHSRSKNIHMIDGKVFDMHRSDYQIPFEELEIWEIQNEAEGMHSMHLHGTHFQVLERRFGPPMTPVDYGWKDTVLVNDNETVRIAVKFKDYRGRYMFHCHILEHEDDGMMINVDVI
jgi:FtsP/CotA-like multicopper oxidase with cupredoxin domain